jgi:hypothetical protein
MFCIAFFPVQKLFPSSLTNIAFTLVVVKLSANKEASSKRLDLVPSSIGEQDVWRVLKIIVFECQVVEALQEFWT